jgi:hypothetical protein
LIFSKNNAIIAPYSEQYKINVKIKNRSLKVVRSFSNNPKPLLPLSGVWLARAGFTIGTRVEVIVRQGCLVIIPEQDNSSNT